MSAGIKDRSGAITTGGTAQVAAEANTGRVYLLIQNIDSGEDLWVSFTETAAADTAGSILLIEGGGAYTAEAGIVPSGPISVVAATTGHKFTLYEG